MIDTEATLTEAVTRKISADSVIMDCMNRKKNIDTIVGAVNGRMTSHTTRGRLAPNVAAVSWSDGGT